MPDSSEKRIAKNTTFLYMRMLVVMLINIFSVRYILKGLGIVDYGVFNVVAGLVTMFSSLSSIISSATLRFHSYVIGEGKEEKVSDVFTASFNIYVVLAFAILVVGEIIGVWFINTQADIPADRIMAANWLYQFTMITFVVNLLTLPFYSLIFAYERMSVFSIISVIECVLKFLLAYSLLHITGDHLILYGIGLLVVQVLSFFVYFFTSKRGGGVYHYKRCVERLLYKKMLSFSGWTLFTSAAGIGISQLVTMITNVFLGPVVNAARAIAFQVNGALSSFTNNIIMAVKPPMIKTYAVGNYDKVNMYFNFSNKAIYYSLLQIILPLYFEMEIILKIWLGVNDSQTILFCRLILINILLLSLNNPISIIVQANGNIKAYSTYVEIPTLLVFPITWALYALGMPAQTAFYVMIIAVIVSHLIRLVCLKRLYPIFSYRDYLRGFVIPAAIITAIVFGVLLFVQAQMDQGILRLFVVLIACVVLTIVLCFLLVFSINERKMFVSIIFPSNIRNWIHK